MNDSGLDSWGFPTTKPKEVPFVPAEPWTCLDPLQPETSQPGVTATAPARRAAESSVPKTVTGTLAPQQSMPGTTMDSVSQSQNPASSSQRNVLGVIDLSETQSDLGPSHFGDTPNVYRHLNFSDAPSLASWVEEPSQAFSDPIPGSQFHSYFAKKKTYHKLRKHMKVDSQPEYMTLKSGGKLRYNTVCDPSEKENYLMCGHCSDQRLFKTPQMLERHGQECPGRMQEILGTQVPVSTQRQHHAQEYQGNLQGLFGSQSLANARQHQPHQHQQQQQQHQHQHQQQRQHQQPSVTQALQMPYMHAGLARHTSSIFDTPAGPMTTPSSQPVSFTPMSQPPSTHFAYCTSQSQQFITPTPPSQPAHPAVHAHHVMHEPVVMSQPVPPVQQPVQGRVISSQGPKTSHPSHAPQPAVVYATSFVKQDTLDADGPTHGGARQNLEPQPSHNDRARGEGIRSPRTSNSNTSEDVAGTCTTVHNDTHGATACSMAHGDVAVVSTRDVVRNHAVSTKPNDDSCARTESDVGIQERGPHISTSHENRPGGTSGTANKQNQERNTDYSAMNEETTKANVDNPKNFGAPKQQDTISEGPSHVSDNANGQSARQNTAQKETTVSEWAAKRKADAEETTYECTTFEQESDTARTDVSEQLAGGNAAFEQCNSPKTTRGGNESTHKAARSKTKPVVELGGSTHDDTVLDSPNIPTTKGKKTSAKLVDVTSQSIRKQKKNGGTSQKTAHHAPTCLPTNSVNVTCSQDNVFTARNDAACDSTQPFGKGASKRQRQLPACTDSSAWKTPRLVRGLPYAFVEVYSECFQEWRREDHFKMTGCHLSKGSPTKSSGSAHSLKMCSFSPLKQHAASQTSPNTQLLLSMPSNPSTSVNFNYLSLQSKSCSPLCSELFSPCSDSFDVQMHAASDVPCDAFTSPVRNQNERERRSPRQDVLKQGQRGRSSPPYMRKEDRLFTPERYRKSARNVGVFCSASMGRLRKRSCKDGARDDTLRWHDRGAEPRAAQKQELHAQCCGSQASVGRVYDTPESNRLTNKMQGLSVKSEHPSQQSQNTRNSMDQHRYGCMDTSVRQMNKLQRNRAKSADPCMLQRSAEGSRTQDGLPPRSHPLGNQLQRGHVHGNMDAYQSNKCDAYPDPKSKPKPKPKANPNPNPNYDKTPRQHKIIKLKKERPQSPQAQIFHKLTDSHLSAQKCQNRLQVKNIEVLSPSSLTDVDRNDSQGKLSASPRPMNKLQRRSAKMDDESEVQRSVSTTSQHTFKGDAPEITYYTEQLGYRRSVPSVRDPTPQTRGFTDWMDVSPVARHNVSRKQEPCQVPRHVTQRCKVESAIPERGVGSPPKFAQGGKQGRRHTETPDVLIAQRSFTTNPPSVRPMNKLQQQRAKSVDVTQPRAKSVDIAHLTRRNTHGQAQRGQTTAGASAQSMEDIYQSPEEPEKQKRWPHCKVEPSRRARGVGSPRKSAKGDKIQRRDAMTPDVLMSRSAENSQPSFTTNPPSARPMNKLQQQRAKSVDVAQQRAKSVDIPQLTTRSTHDQARRKQRITGASAQRMEDIHLFPKESGKQKPLPHCKVEPSRQTRGVVSPRKSAEGDNLQRGHTKAPDVLMSRSVENSQRSFTTNPPSARPMNKLQQQRAKSVDVTQQRAKSVDIAHLTRRNTHGQARRGRTGAGASAQRMEDIYQSPEEPEKQKRWPHCKVEPATQERRVGSPRKSAKGDKIQRRVAKTPDVLMSRSAENSQRSFTTNPPSARPMNKLQQQRAKSVDVMQQQSKIVDVAHLSAHNTHGQAQRGQGRASGSTQRMQGNKQQPLPPKDAKKISPVLRHEPHSKEARAGIASGHRQHVPTVPQLPAYESRPRELDKATDPIVTLDSPRRSSTICPSTLFSRLATKSPSDALSHGRVSAADTPQLRSRSIALMLAPRLAPRFPHDTMCANLSPSSRPAVRSVLAKRSAGDSSGDNRKKRSALTQVRHATDVSPLPCSKTVKVVQNGAPVHAASESSVDSNGSDDTLSARPNATKSKRNAKLRTAQPHKSAKHNTGVKTGTRSNTSKYLENSSATSIRSKRSVGDTLKPGTKVKSTTHKTSTHGKPHAPASPSSAKINKPQLDETISMESLLDSIRRRTTTRAKTTPAARKHAERHAGWSPRDKGNAAAPSMQNTTVGHKRSRAKMSRTLTDVSSNASTHFDDGSQSPVATASTITSPSHLLSISSTHWKHNRTKAVHQAHMAPTTASAKCATTAINSKKRMADFGKERKTSKAKKQAI